MAFESISQRYDIAVLGFQEKWLPLISLYDPDLPLFPIQYFHKLDPSLPAGRRPSETDRVFGYIHRVNFSGGSLTATVAINKDLGDPQNARYIPVLEQEVRDRLGHNDPVNLADVRTAFAAPLDYVNPLLEELWYKVVDPAFGGKLPFGRMWDRVFGLVRFITSWRSDGGRKGELIQTHSFVKHFGVRIATGGGIHVDFYLLPTWEEFTNTANPLALFPIFADLMRAANLFVSRYCTTRAVGTASFSSFAIPASFGVRRLSNAVSDRLRNELPSLPARLEEALLANWSAFNRGPQRSIVALMMFHDLRMGFWSEATFTPGTSAQLYLDLKGTYQSPKVIHLFAQQCFGSHCALPIDNWVAAFFAYPFSLAISNPAGVTTVFSACPALAKVERLIWVAAQGRKVHSSVCENILWCVRRGSPSGIKLRGPNPLSCKICAIRDACPGYLSIANARVRFNYYSRRVEGFGVYTSARNNTSASQRIIRSVGPGIVDEYSTRDEPTQFSRFPVPGHSGEPMTVADFIAQY